MKRRDFITKTGIVGGGLMLGGGAAFAGSRSMAITAESFPVVRTPAAKRHFTSKAVEAAITEFKSKVKDPELGWLFENCFPNTLDTTVTHTNKNGKPDTYVITGDIDAMWLRDSSAQVRPSSYRLSGQAFFGTRFKKKRILMVGICN